MSEYERLLNQPGHQHPSHCSHCQILCRGDDVRLHRGWRALWAATYCPACEAAAKLDAAAADMAVSPSIYGAHRAYVATGLRYAAEIVRGEE